MFECAIQRETLLDRRYPIANRTSIGQRARARAMRRDFSGSKILFAVVNGHGEQVAVATYILKWVRKNCLDASVFQGSNRIEWELHTGTGPEDSRSIIVASHS